MSKGEKLTALVVAGNERDKIRGCLESVKWADEILVVVDSRSDDGTEQICRDYTDRVLRHEYRDCGTQKNWALPQAIHPWVFVIDADEVATPELQKEIRDVLSVERPRYDGYYIRRRSFFLGKRIDHCGWQSDYVLRLFKRDKGRYQDRRVHARLLLEGPTDRLHGSLLHYTYDSMAEYFEVFARYTSWAAEDLRRAGRSASWHNLALRPLARFLKMYLLKRGFLDGKEGLVLCCLAAMSVFTKYVKLWEMQRKDPGGAVPREG